MVRSSSKKSAAQALGSRRLRTWKRFLKWLDTHSDSRWVFRGLGDKRFDLIPGIGRSDYSLANALGLDGREDELPDAELPRDFRYLESTPVFFGHYWLSGPPAITAPNAACLDFSVAKEGYLTAYRWSGETQLSEQNLISVAA
jgi:hypothetical protein